MPVKLAPSEVSRDSVQVVLRDSTSISPDCSAVKRSLADSGTNLILVASLKIAAAMARQTSTSSPVQLPLSSGDENPGRPWPTPQDSMPRSLTVLRVCAEAAWAERPAARARVTTRDTRFMGWAFQGGRPEIFFRQRLTLWGQPADPSLKSVPPAMQFDVQSGRAMDRISRQAPQLAAMIVGMHHRTTGVPGQGVDCRLLRPVINLPGPAPPFGVVFAIKLWLRHNVLDNANAWVFRTTVSPTRQAVRHGLFVGRL